MRAFFFLSGGQRTLQRNAIDMTSVAQNIRDMPTWLKLMTAHCLACFVGFAAFAIPRSNMRFNGRQVTYAEFWASMGWLLGVCGVFLTVAGVLFLLRVGIGRYFYLANFAALLVGLQLYRGNVLGAAIGAGFVVALGAYLFRNERMRAYFAR